MALSMTGVQSRHVTRIDPAARAGFLAASRLPPSPRPLFCCGYHDSPIPDPIRKTVDTHGFSLWRDL